MIAKTIGAPRKGTPPCPFGMVCNDLRRRRLPISFIRRATGRSGLQSRRRARRVKWVALKRAARACLPSRSGPRHASQRQPSIAQGDPGGGRLQGLPQDGVLLRGDFREQEAALVAEEPLPLGVRLGAYDPAPHDLGGEGERPEGGREFDVQGAPGRRMFRCSMRAPLRLTSRRRTVSTARVRAAGRSRRVIRGARRCFWYSVIATPLLAASSPPGLWHSRSGLQGHSPPDGLDWPPASLRATPPRLYRSRGHRGAPGTARCRG